MNGQNRRYDGRMVILDTRAGWIYIGRFKGEDGASFILEDADAYDVSETSMSKQEYLLMIKKDGVAPNRKQVAVLKDKVTAITFMEDVLDK